MSLSETGKGIWIQIQGREYVTPAERVRKVISGEHRKVAVFEGRGERILDRTNKQWF